jgi:general stress protein YciG
MSSSDTPKRKGFASMTPERRSEIARQGGRTAHALGVAHEYTADTARAAGRKGGAAVAKDREYMSAIGRKGGLTRAENARLRKEQGL